MDINYIMAIGLGDIYEKIKELITVVDKVRVNTEEIKELKKSQEEMQGNILKLMEGQKHILERLEYKEELSSLKIKLAEHIAACEKAKA
jgi:cell division FtsZ-interacting protein ZapD